ncbi:helix-turn-helix domain-containing protein [Rhizobium sp. CC-YZS058]|uniref:helix-turn-helix domain-containing protein n=1 Tax=Rhizobium sp. CC-YZS058 TaxID=3042153 RepID=UPI002B05DCAD|nr:helix-turn-helix domain-containing protein [Rhizobium sp. CC-YZS058]MEA3533687.1 helix-turn-helix domain-containing protein [Rhizobium sp. CC-YZS058]
MHRAPKGDKISRAEHRRLKEVGRIKERLILAKLTLAEIDKAYNLPAGTAGNAVHEPHLAGERAIAAALKTRPELLWFTRYHSDGHRLSPQPSENYRHGRRGASEHHEAA